MEHSSQSLSPCCQKSMTEQDSGRPGLILRICDQCGRRHFELNVDAGHIGAKMAKVG